jgi:hypothetical protein
MPRFKLFQPTEMIVSGQASRVHILNISISGALVHSAQPVALASLVELQCGSHLRAARVAWVNGLRAGVAFSIPFNDDNIRQIIRK